jgi:hypothetical protein
MRTYFKFMLLVSILAAAVAAVAVSNTPVSADTCTIQPSSLAYSSPSYSYGGYANVVVPVSATCAFVGGQLYAVGTATNATANAQVHSSYAKLFAAYGTNIYTGQLTFSLPSEVTGYTVQLSISIYSGVYNGYNYSYNGFSNGSPLTTSVESVHVNANNYYVNYAGCYYSNNCVQSAQVYNSCHTPSSNGTVQCVGYLYQNSNSCVELVIPIVSPIGLISYQYFTLQKLPATYPAIGTWVTVTGQLHLGPNVSSTGAACPGNYLNVTSITS